MARGLGNITNSNCRGQIAACGGVDSEARSRQGSPSHNSRASIRHIHFLPADSNAVMAGKQARAVLAVSGAARASLSVKSHIANPVFKKGRGSFHRRASLLGAAQGTSQRWNSGAYFQ